MKTAWTSPSACSTWSRGLALAASALLGCEASGDADTPDTTPADASDAPDLANDPATSDTSSPWECHARPIVMSCRYEAHGTKLCVEFRTDEPTDCESVGPVAVSLGDEPCDRSGADYFGSCLIGCGSPNEQVAVFYTPVNVDIVCTNQAGTWFPRGQPVP